MNPYAAYQQKAPVAASRIDLLLAAYDGAVDRITAGLAELHNGKRAQALSLIAKAQLIIAELAAGVRLDVDPELGANTLRLYEFATFNLARGDAEGLHSALGVLTNLRAGFAAIRAEAIKLERAGLIPPLSDNQTFSSLA